MSVAGTYTFSFVASFRARWYLYRDSFDPKNPSNNLLTEGYHAGGSVAVQFSAYLEAVSAKRRKRATKRYVSVFTSDKAGDTGTFSNAISGLSTASVDDFDLGSTNPASSDSNGSGSKVGIIVGSVVGGVIGLICLFGLCCGLISVLVFCCCFRRRPLHSNARYVRRGRQINPSLGTAIFQTGAFSGSMSIDGMWQRATTMNLSFYPGAGYVIYGKGSDEGGAYAIHGVYSIRTLRMAFDKIYDERRSETIQVEWDVNREVFHGDNYSKVNGRREKHEYMIRKVKNRSSGR